jgi:transcriptional regulator with XRE-family HTH domain
MSVSKSVEQGPSRDDAGVSYSKIIGSRLAQAMGVRGWSQTQLADVLGITNNTLGRIIAGQERLNMNLCCRAMELMDYEPSLLLSEDPITGNWTGIPAVDAMLADIYGEMSESGVDTLGQYVTRDYLCCTHHYTEVSNVELEDGGAWEERAPEGDRRMRQRVYDKAHHGRDLMGIPYELEHKDNVELWSKGSYFIRNVISATPIGEDRVIVETAAQWKQIDDGMVQSRPRERFFDLLYLKNSFASIAKGARVQIRRKVWWYAPE